MKGILYSTRITQNTTYDFFSETQGKGVYHLSLKNIGNTPLLIDDAAQEILQPNDVFIIESPIGLLSRVELRFLDTAIVKAQNLCVVRYIVPVNE